jgi:serine/threonine protein kinase
MIPDTLLHYRILKPLGSGGMGDVYLAEDTKLNRRVALKVLPRGPVEDVERRQRFEREARAVAALNHPNIVTIHSVEQADGVVFLTMELVEGQSLSQVIPKGGLGVSRLLKLAIPLTEAVAAAHERGITHRDLKPANVMVTADGRLKVLDFGLAKLADATDPVDASMTALQPEPLTGEGRIVGTVSYMSPEQAEGKPIDHRSDLFSLGVLLYEMATGERPFKGDTNVSVLSSILKDAPRSITEINQSLPRDLARIVKRALVKDPDHRYQTAKDLRNDLETLKEELESGTAELNAAASAGRSPSRRSRAGLLAGVGIAAIAVLGIVWFTLWRDRRAPTPGPTGTSAVAARPFDSKKLTRLTSSGQVTAAAISGDGRYVVHVVSQDGKQSLWLRQVATASNVRIVEPAPVRFDGVSFSPDGNYVYYVIYPPSVNFSVVYQIPVLGGTPRKIIEDVDTPLAFSPDGKQFAFVRGSSRLGANTLLVAAADGTGERSVAVRKNPLSYPLSNVAWSPDGATLALPARVDAQGRMQILAVNVATGVETPIGDRVWNFVDYVAWMPGGRGLLAAADDGTPGATTQVWYVEYPGGKARRVTNDLNGYGQVHVSADGATIMAVQGEGHSHLWVAPFASPGSGKQITTGTGRVDGAGGIAWTVDHRILYTSNSSDNADIWISDASGANQRQLTVDPAPDSNPAVTPDGRSIVFFSARAGGSIWQMDLDGGNQRPLLTEAGLAWPVVSPDSQWLYYTSFAGPHRQVWRRPLAGGPAERLSARWDALGVNTEGVFYHPTLALAGLSPDGKLGVGYYADPERRGWRAGVFPMAGGTPIRFEILIPNVAWTPDGKNLLYMDAPAGVANIFLQPLSGGAPRPITTFTTDGLIGFGFALSRDGKQLALARGNGTSDVVLITQER